LLVFAALAMFVATACKKGPNVAEVAKQMEASGKKGTEWLKTKQLADGSFDDRDYVKVGMTSLAAIALMDQNLNESDPNVKRAITFLAAQQKEDGAIRIQEGIENYETALSTIALKKTGNKAYDETMKKAQAYLFRLQCGVGDGLSASDIKYGGIGYGRRKTPDLSNTQFGLEALKESELAASSETFKRAITFIQRCQNLKQTNTQPWAGSDGGFIYSPEISMVNKEATGSEPRHSYGSMTYAGLLSFSYCDVPKDDPRVKAALDWLRAHYTLDANPGMDKKGLYYYYMVMAKALSAYGEKYLVDNKGQRHYWALDLASKLIELQQPDGSWVNSDSQWMEDNQSLVTAYCMIALNRCRPFLVEK
jgi:squalene-hopene/tetraprenyl-beta-curcumene cyclase